MDKAGFSIRSCSVSVRKTLLVIFASIFLLTTVLSEVAWAQANKTDKQKVARQVAQNYIQIGKEHYRRGNYTHAEQNYLRARLYSEYLTSSEREELNELLEKAHKAALARKQISEDIQTAKELLGQNKLIRAKAYFEKIRDGEFSTEEERALSKEVLEEIGNKLVRQRKEISELYSRSVKFYRSGQLEKAREGFIKVAESGLLEVPAGQRPEDYLVKIEDILTERGKAPVPAKEVPVEEKPAQKAPEVVVEAVEKELLVDVEPVDKAEREVVREPKPSEVAEPRVTEPVVAEPVAEEVGFIDEINRRINIIRGRTKAVVNDAKAKAKSYINQGQFDKAEEVVASAQRTVNQNQMQLGGVLYRQYTSELKQLAETIIQGRQEEARQLQKKKEIDAIETHRKFREQMEVDREKRMTELMDSALASEKEQRYLEAIGQLESLLAIDARSEYALKLREEAMVRRDTLDDMIIFRKQLEAQRETDRERANLLRKADEAGIPYAEEMTHPRNWREIVASQYRKEEEAIGQDPVNKAVYDQLKEVVDLSGLTPETPLREAIVELRNSVVPPLKIVVRWRDLIDNADIDQSTAINMDAISEVPLGTALKLLLESVSGFGVELGYGVDNGVITIATVESLPRQLRTRVYDISILLSRPADYRGRLGTGREGGRGGGGMGGMGGGMGGMGGGMMDFGEYFEEEEEEELTREEIAERAVGRAEALRMLIQETIEPDSWIEAGLGGQGSLTFYQNKQLIVQQTPEILDRIGELIREMRKLYGHQVSIEARFLLVGENFLEDIGLDVDFSHLPLWEEAEDGLFPPIVPPDGGDGDGDGDGDANQADWINLVPSGNLYVFQGHSLHTGQTITGLSGSLAGLAPGLDLGFSGMLLDNLQVDFLLRATQAHRDSKSLTAPRVSVLSGETASMQIQRTIRYGFQPNVQGGFVQGGVTGGLGTQQTIQQNVGLVPTGTVLNVTPIITPDKKHVLLDIQAQLRKFLGFESTEIETPMPDGTIVTYSMELPQTELSQVRTRVTVPDGGTLILGGLKLTEEVELESGVPILSKIPGLGRLFSNRSKIKDHKILLILVKPTIILQEEADAEAIGAME